MSKGPGDDSQEEPAAGPKVEPSLKEGARRKPRRPIATQPGSILESARSSGARTSNTSGKSASKSADITSGKSTGNASGKSAGKSSGAGLGMASGDDWTPPPFPVSDWDRYEFIRPLGQGSMGAVFLA